MELRFRVTDSVRPWFNRAQEPEPCCAETTHNRITQSKVFCQEIAAHPTLVERKVIAALAHAPGLSGFYV